MIWWTAIIAEACRVLTSNSVTGGQVPTGGVGVGAHITDSLWFSSNSTQNT